MDGALNTMSRRPARRYRRIVDALTDLLTQVRSNGAQLAELARLLDQGAIRVAIDSVYPLADAAKAHERAAGGHIQGKIALTVR